MVQARDVPEDAEGRARVEGAACGLRSPRLIAYLLMKPTCAGLVGHSAGVCYTFFIPGKGGERCTQGTAALHPTA